MAFSTNTNNFLALIGRALIALLFIPSGIDKIRGFEGTVRYINTASNLPFAEAATVVAILIEVVLVALLLLGYQTRWVALITAVYTVVLAFAFHAYWTFPAPQVMMQKILFYKDLAIAGALFFIAGTGPGGWSVDARKEDRSIEPIAG